jgi:hypothetical protein
MEMGEPIFEAHGLIIRSDGRAMIETARKP